MSVTADKIENRESIIKPWIITGKQFTSIKDVCIALIIAADHEKFFDLDAGKMKKKANEFVNKFASTHQMKTHTVQPLSWSFEIDGERMFN